MTESVMLFAILAIIWVLVVFNQRLKRTIRNNKPRIMYQGLVGDWGNHECACGTKRPGWKARAMNRPENTVLLECPGCHSLWEEQMSLYGNKWRQVDHDYARECYKGYDE